MQDSQVNVQCSVVENKTNLEVYLVEVVPSYALLESQNHEITVKVVSANLMVLLHLKI